MVAIVYVGNAVVDTTHTKNIIEKACRYTHVDKQKLYEQMNKCEYVDTAADLTTFRTLTEPSRQNTAYRQAPMPH